MKTTTSLQLLDTQDNNISPIIGVDSIFIEDVSNPSITKRKTIYDKILMAGGKDGSLNVRDISYDDASQMHVLVDVSTILLENVEPSLYALSATQISMSEFMGIIEDKIHEGGGGGGFDPTIINGSIAYINSSITDISNRLNNVSTNVDDISTKVDDVSTKLDSSFIELDSSINELWDSSKSGIQGVKRNGSLLDSVDGIVDVSVPTNLDQIADGNTYKRVTQNEKNVWNGKQDTLYSEVNIKTINHISILGSGNIDVSSGGGSFDPTDINSSITDISNRLNDVSTRLYNVSNNLNSSVQTLWNSSVDSGTINVINTSIDSLYDVSLSAQDIKYYDGVYVGFRYNSNSGNYLNIFENTLLAYCSNGSELINNYMPIDASGKTKDPTETTNSSVSFILDINYPILIAGKNASVYSNHSLYDNAYIYKNNVDLENTYKFITTGQSSKRYCLFPQYRKVYLKGRPNYYNKNLITLDSENLIVDDVQSQSAAHKNKIDTTDRTKEYRYIFIGYSYSSDYSVEQSAQTYIPTTRFHFVGGMPKVYYWDSSLNKLVKDDDINDLKIDVSTLKNIDVSNLDASIDVLWDSSTELKTKHIRIDSGYANLPIACSSIHANLTNSSNYYSPWWLQTNEFKFYLDWPIYCMGNEDVQSGFSDNVYIYKNNVDFTNANIIYLVDGVTNNNIGDEYFIKGHVDGSIFYLTNNGHGTCTQDVIFSLKPTMEDGYQYIPIGHIVDVSNQRPIINFVGGFVNNRIFEFKNNKGFIPYSDVETALGPFKDFDTWDVTQTNAAKGTGTPFNFEVGAVGHRFNNTHINYIINGGDQNTIYEFAIDNYVFDELNTDTVDLEIFGKNTSGHSISFSLSTDDLYRNFDFCIITGGGLTYTIPANHGVFISIKYCNDRVNNKAFIVVHNIVVEQ